MTNQKDFNRRLALLKTEVDLDFPGLVTQLESGLKVMLIADKRLGNGLNPDILRRYGGTTMLCNFYGAAVIFANENQIAYYGNPTEPSGSAAE